MSGVIPPAATPDPAQVAMLPPAPDTPSWMPALQKASNGLAIPYKLVARVSARTWISVRMEDGRALRETVPAGDERVWISNRPFVIAVGNAGAVKFELNGRALPSFGPNGATVRDITLPPSGEQP
jgi:hypothetical protein